jgi:hypothetical protein
VPPAVGGVESILGPIGDMTSPLDLGGTDPADPPGDDGTDDSDDSDNSDDSGDQTNVDATLGIINTGPVNIAPPVDEPITSGGDGGPGI